MRTCATPGTAQATRTGGNKAGSAATIKALFGAAKAVLCRKDEDEPQPQTRRRGETDKGFVAAGRAILHRAARQTGAAARGRFAALWPAKAAPEAAPADAYVHACLSLSDTLDWFNLWQDNANNEQWHDNDFSAKQDQYFPQP